MPTPRTKQARKKKAAKRLTGAALTRTYFTDEQIERMVSNVCQRVWGQKALESRCPPVEREAQIEDKPERWYTAYMIGAQIGCAYRFAADSDTEEIWLPGMIRDVNLEPRNRVYWKSRVAEGTARVLPGNPFTSRCSSLETCPACGMMKKPQAL